mgnify:CR=1 FL=1
MTRQVDEFLLHEMEAEDNDDTINACIDGTDDIIESMMEVESRNEVSARIFPVAERFQEPTDPETFRIAESLAKDDPCASCKLKDKKGECEKCKYGKGGNKHASN